jgi:hypothetical protein
VPIGFRSVPATDLPSAVLEPGQSRHLATRVVCLNGPPQGGRVTVPQEGEELELCDVSEVTGNEPLQKALRLLSAEKAPGSVAQMVFWRLAGMDWPWIARLSKPWANTDEVMMARRFLDGLIPRDVSAESETGVIYFEIHAKGPGTEALAAELRSALKGSRVLGLRVELGVPENPDGPSIACRVDLHAADAHPTAVSRVWVTEPSGRKWTDSGSFTLPYEAVSEAKGSAEAWADGLCGGLVERLVHVRLAKDLTRDERGRNVMNFRVRIDNASPLVLHGLTIVGTKADATPATLVGVSVAPRRSLVVPATKEAVDRLGLKSGVRAYAADLSGL